MAEVLAVYKYESPAKTLVAILNANGMPSQYRYENATDGHVVCLLDDSTLMQAQAVTAKFNQNPNAREFTQIAWQSGGSVPMGMNISLSGIVQRLRTAPLVSLLLMTSIVLFTLVYGLGQIAVYEALFFQPFDAMSVSHQWWRVVTPALMHFSVEHLVFNMIWWGWLGSQVEQRFHWFWLASLFVIIAIASNIAQYCVSGWQFGGMSGVVYGLTGYVWWMQWLRPQVGLNIPIGLVGLSLVWMMLGFADVLWMDMANTAHLVGLISGCCAALCHAALIKKSD